MPLNYVLNPARCQQLQGFESRPGSGEHIMHVAEEYGLWGFGFGITLVTPARYLQALNGAPVAGGRVLHVSLQPPRERSARQ